MTAAHFTAVQTILKGVLPDIPAHDTDASHVAGDAEAYPYLVLSGGTPRPFSDTLGGCTDGSQGLIRVTHVATAPGAVRELVDITRAALAGAQLEIPDRYGWDLELEDSLDVTPDRDVQLQGLAVSAFPFYAVDIYRLGSTIPLA